MGVLPHISDAVGNVHEGALSIVDHQSAPAEDGVKVKSTGIGRNLGKQLGDTNTESQLGQDAPEARKTLITGA